MHQALERDVTYTLHKPVQRTFPTAPVMVMGMDHQWVADLVDMQKLSKYNRGIKYLLTVVDALSKYAWVEPIRDKSVPNMKQAWGKIRQPRRIQTDQVKEFYNTSVQKLFRERGIHHF